MTETIICFVFLAAAGFSIGQLIVNVAAYVLNDVKMKPTLNVIGYNVAAIAILLMLAALNGPTQ